MRISDWSSDVCSSDLALAADQQIVGRQLVDCLAYGALADLEPGSKLELAGDGLAGLPVAAIQSLQDQALDLPIQRAECGTTSGEIGRAACRERVCPYV